MRLRLSVQPGFAAVCCLLLALDASLPWLLLLTVAVHELGHLLALQCLGTEDASLELGLGGGVIDCAPLPPGALAITALAGPLANLLWAGLMFFPAPQAALLSLGTAAFNLLPVPPLDGYHVLNDLVIKKSLFASPNVTRIAYGALLVLVFFTPVVSNIIGFVEDALMNGLGGAMYALLGAVGIL